MSNRAYAILTGMFLILLGAALIAGAVWLSGEARQTGQPYIIVSRGSVSGLSADSAVFFRGVPAGKVNSINFASHSPYNILIHIEVEKSIPLTRGTYAVLKTRALTGTSQIQLNKRGHDQARLMTSKNNPTRILMRPSLIESLSKSGRQLLSKLTKMADNLSSLLNKQNRRHLRSVLVHTDQASGELVSLEKKLEATLREAPALSQDLHGSLRQINRLVANLNEVAGSLKGAVKNTSRLTNTGAQASKEFLQTTIPKINATLDQLNSAGANIQNLTKSLQDEPQRLFLGPRKIRPGPGESKAGGPHS